MFEKLKKYLLSADIKNKIAQVSRRKQLIHPDNVRTIGILYVVGEEKEYLKLTEFISRLQNEKKEVRSLGWVNYKEPPHYCYARLMFDYITPKNINWYGKPLGKNISDFIQKDFDVLFNFDTSKNPSLTYVAALSSAKLKVGLYNENDKDYYDLMISTEKNLTFPEIADVMIANVAMFSSKE